MACVSSGAISAATLQPLNCLMSWHQAPHMHGYTAGTRQLSHPWDEFLCHTKWWDSGTALHPGGRTCWVRCPQRQSQGLLKHWSWIHFDLTWGVPRPKRSFGVMKCWPALFVNPFLICLIHLDAGLCAGTSKTSLWSKDKLIKHVLLFFMTKSVWVIFSDQTETPESLWVVAELVTASQRWH